MARKPRVYLDSCYYIDAAKGRLGVSLRPDRATHIPYVEKLLLASLNGEIDVYASTLVISECMHIGEKDVSQETKDAFLALLTSGGAVTLIAVDIFVAERARDLLWQHKISCGGAADMVHVATALEPELRGIYHHQSNTGSVTGRCSSQAGKAWAEGHRGPADSSVACVVYPAALYGGSRRFQRVSTGFLAIS